MEKDEQMKWKGIEQVTIDDGNDGDHTKYKNVVKNDFWNRQKATEKKNPIEIWIVYFVDKWTPKITWNKKRERETEISSKTRQKWFSFRSHFVPLFLLSSLSPVDQRRIQWVSECSMWWGVIDRTRIKEIAFVASIIESTFRIGHSNRVSGPLPIRHQFKQNEKLDRTKRKKTKWIVSLSFTLCFCACVYVRT